MKKKAIAILQVFLGLGIVGFIFHKMASKGEVVDAIRAASGNWVLVVLGTSCFLGSLTAVVFRWKTLLDAQGMHFTIRRLGTLYFVGHFFNSFLIGSTGGDLVKAYLVTKEMPEKKTASVATVFIDRIVGLIALVLLVLVLMLARLSFFLQYKEMKIAMVFNTVLFLGTMGGLTLVFRKNIFEHFAFFRRLEERTALGRILSKAYTAFQVCVTNPIVLIKTLLLSFANHMIMVLCCYLLGLALEIQLGFIDYLVICPIINAVGAIPITPGGLGTREATAVFLFGALGVASAPAAMVTLLLYVCMTFWSLVGGVVYFFYIYRRGERLPESLDK